MRTFRTPIWVFLFWGSLHAVWAAVWNCWCRAWRWFRVRFRLGRSRFFLSWAFGSSLFFLSGMPSSMTLIGGAVRLRAPALLLVLLLAALGVKELSELPERPESTAEPKVERLRLEPLRPRPSSSLSCNKVLMLFLSSSTPALPPPSSSSSEHSKLRRLNLIGLKLRTSLMAFSSSGSR